MIPPNSSFSAWGPTGSRLLSIGRRYRRHLSSIPSVATLSVTLIGLAYAHPTRGTLPAFPGAEGFGASASGGRGGAVVHVTNLNDSGPGSFREAVRQPGRIIVFDVGGYIELKSPVPVAGNITIAGQTAPGDGITLRNEELSVSNVENVILRYLRVRTGLRGTKGKDGIGVYKGKRQIFDHVSVSWGRDETFSVNNSEDITIQNCIIAEGLLRHSMGGLVQWNTISIHHCLYTANNDRNPKAKGKIDFVNNIVYNWGEYGFVAGDSAGKSEVNVVGNYFIAGPNSQRLHDPIMRGNANFSLFFRGNYYDGNQNGTLDGKLISRADVDDTLTWQDAAYPYPSVTVEPAPDAYRRVVESVGASLKRDGVDRRIIDDLVKQKGKLIRDEEEVGGFGTLRGGTPPMDTDGDGMPDAWEKAHGLNPNDPKDANGDFDHTGYTNIEKYINGLVDGSYDARRYGLDRNGG